MIFLPAGEGDGEVEFHRVASGDDGVIDLRRFTGRRCGSSTFAHGGYGGFRFFAAGTPSRPGRRSPRYQ